MDFNQFDSVAAGDKGAWMHVNSPIDGAPLYIAKGKPCRVKVLGIEGSIGNSAMKAVRDASGMDAEGTDPDEELILQTKPFIVGFENIYNGNVLAEAPKDVEWFLRLQRVIGGDHPTFLQQAQSFARLRGNILGNGLTGLWSPPSKSAG